MLEEGMMEIDECDTDEFGTLDSSEKTIAILADRWWPHAAKQKGGEYRNHNYSYAIYGINVMSAHILEISLARVAMVLRFPRDTQSMVK